MELYQTVAIGLPADVVEGMRHAPFRPGLEAIAHTLVYEAQLVGGLTFPTEMVASIKTPTLVMTGEQRPPIMREAARALEETLPDCRHVMLAGQTHNISPDATAAAIDEFLSG